MRFDFPQVELHLHLDGSFRPETVWELAERKGVAMPAADLAGYRAYLAATTDCASVNEYLERFELPLQVMQDAEALTRVTRELVEDLADRGTAYAEIRFAPQLHTREGMTQRQAVEAVLAGRRQGCEARPGIDIGILLCMMCVGPETANWEQNAETVAVAAEYLGQGRGHRPRGSGGHRAPPELCAPLPAGPGEAHPLHLPRRGQPRPGYRGGRPGFRRPAHRPRPPHLSGPGPRPPGGGSGRDPGDLPYEAHPAKNLMEMGLGVCINTDNATLAGVTLADEYRHCLDEMGFTYEDLLAMNRCAIRASFAPMEVKERILTALKRCQ